MTRAALDAGTATRHHGARPHLIIVAPQQVATGQHTGVVQTAFSGPLPAGEGLRIVDDDAVSKLICDDRTIPVEATEEVRNVPAGVFRVFVRDGGRCIADGCDITRSTTSHRGHRSGRWRRPWSTTSRGDQRSGRWRSVVTHQEPSVGR
jgi:hypothetical protein